MIRHLLIFAACFALGAVAVTVVRTIAHRPYAADTATPQGNPQPAPAPAADPHAGHAATPAPAADPHGGHAATPAPTADPHAGHAATPAPTADPHAGHAAAPPSAAAPPADAKPVNTVCALCGMPVNPKLGTAVYKGKVIGFGCKSCPEEFRKDPDRYGPAFLANQVIEE